MTTLSALQSLVAQGESETLQFKRHTAELRHAGETLSVCLLGQKSYSTAQSWIGASQASAWSAKKS